MNRRLAAALAAAALAMTATACGVEANGGKVTVCADVGRTLGEFAGKANEYIQNPEKFDQAAKDLSSDLAAAADRTADKSLKQLLDDMAATWNDFAAGASDPAKVQDAVDKAQDHIRRLSEQCT
ncbi:hypothetical protein [Bailinhaonella thermotolerans]|uniref:Uncharacterized protein n=1 Tax=Bailinhaonella thermotolerans TaxID=1070861 RepID=A0A3A4B7F1_9ACTN|nr:hypothetical protein [Bailinhaonella thermotolerans]RJL34151.1 hypothetical protein D5H75_06630 [Bailinhaonella thermotolerans]